MPDTTTVNRRCVSRPLQGRARRIGRLAAGLAGALWAGATGCSPETPKAGSFFSGECRLDTASADAPCASCLDLELATTLGTEEDEGFLVDRGTLGDIVRDQNGNYWVGQRDQIKVFDSAGTFVAAVGRAGQGPMEFAFAQPMHTDSAGRVHVFDNRNARVSIIGSDLNLHEARRLPATAVFAMTPVADGDQYAIQAWIPDPPHIGLPLHIVGDGEIIRSFGAGIEPDSEPDSDVDELDSFTAQRRLTTDSHGNVFSSHYYDYVVEAWSPDDGSRIGSWRDRLFTTARAPPVRGPGRTRLGTKSTTSGSIPATAFGLCSDTDAPTGGTPWSKLPADRDKCCWLPRTARCRRTITRA